MSVIVYSFNASRLVTVWAGFSTHWYGELLRNEQIRAAALVSLEVAVLGGDRRARARHARGLRAGALPPLPRPRRSSATLATAPLVMPEVITGLSLLLLFVALEQAIGWPHGRGILTIVIAHMTLGLAYVAVVVEARLASFDRSLEEAALDLGARPWKVFAVITLPLIAPALVAGWLLAFTLSLDDLVIASFTSGPASTTLPMVIFSSVGSASARRSTRWRRSSWSSSAVVVTRRVAPDGARVRNRRRAPS